MQGLLAPERLAMASLAWRKSWQWFMKKGIYHVSEEAYRHRRAGI